MSQTHYSILVVDDEHAQRQLLRAVLEDQFTVTTAEDGREALTLLESRSFDLVVTDERMPGLTGIELIREIKDRFPEIPIIVLTAYGSIQTAVEAIKLGAQDYLSKPLKSPEELRLVVTRILQDRAIRNRNLVHQAETEAEFPPDIIAHSDNMKEVLLMAERVADQSTTVLLLGESGTGKEVVARLIHRRSPRAEEAFVAVNCAALADSLLESELFGHEKGAFTGAVRSRRGRFELANGGTLFLDEISEISVSLQPKLLRILEERQFERVGGTRTITVDVRLIAATNMDLQAAIKQNRFREDLYYRLNIFPIRVPPLRERRDDILPLAHFFVKKISTRMGRGPAQICPEAEQALMSHDWPGNVRELRNAVERALIVSRKETVRPGDLPLASPEPRPSTPRPRTISELEKAAILESLTRNNGDRRKTSEQLGISLRKLHYRLKTYGITGDKGEG